MLMARLLTASSHNTESKNWKKAPALACSSTMVCPSCSTLEMKFRRCHALAWTWTILVGASPSLSHNSRDSYLTIVHCRDERAKLLSFSLCRRYSSCATRERRSRADSSQETTSLTISSCSRTFPTNQSFQLFKTLTVFLSNQSSLMKGFAPCKGQHHALSTAWKNPAHFGRPLPVKGASVCSSKGAWSEQREGRAWSALAGNISSHSFKMNALSIRSRVG
jgi:hypothetical protein